MLYYETMIFNSVNYVAEIVCKCVHMHIVAFYNLLDDIFHLL